MSTFDAAPNSRWSHPDSELTVPLFYESRYRPNYHAQASPKTVQRYRDTLKHWATRVGPSVRLVDLLTQPGLLQGFKGALLAPPADPPQDSRQLSLFADEPPPGASTLAIGTANCHIRQLNAILAKAGPRAPKNRDALCVLPELLWVKPYKQPRPRPKAVSADKLAEIYRACQVATFPEVPGVLPEHWWKALIIVGLFDGFRHEGLLGLPWDGVDLARKTVRLPDTADKCDTERLKPMPEIVILHLMRIRSGRPLIFEWPHSERTFYREWHRIQDAAGLDKKDHAKLHDLKRTCGTWLARAGASPWAIQQMLDHGSIETAKHYIDPAEEMRDAVDRVKPPAAFLEDFEPGEAAG
jgi:integrase